MGRVVFKNSTTLQCAIVIPPLSDILVGLVHARAELSSQQPLTHQSLVTLDLVELKVHGQVMDTDASGWLASLAKGAAAASASQLGEDPYDDAGERDGAVLALRPCKRTQRFLCDHTDAFFPDHASPAHACIALVRAVRWLMVVHPARLARLRRQAAPGTRRLK